MQDRFDFGLYASYEEHRHFGIMPEAGVIIPIGDRLWSLLGSTNHSYALGTRNYRASSYLGINVGAVFENRPQRTFQFFISLKS
jgi:hypothetical protein